MENIKISNYGYVAQQDEHESSKFADAGSNPVIPKKCELCGLEFSNGAQKANHIRWKHIEPFRPADRKQKSQKWLDAMHKRKGVSQHHIKAFCKCEFCGLEKEMSKETFTKHKKYCKANPNAAPFPSHLQSEETKKKLSEIGRNNKYRRIMRHTQEYKGVLYDSSWEVEFAKRLEELGIDFERPKIPIEYKDAENNTHNYFPDFYIPKINKFVEIKNPYLFNNDPKVQILKERIDIIWLTDLDSISKFEI